MECFEFKRVQILVHAVPFNNNIHYFNLLFNAQCLDYKLNMESNTISISGLLLKLSVCLLPTEFLKNIALIFKTKTEKASMFLNIYFKI